MKYSNITKKGYTVRKYLCVALLLSCVKLTTAETFEERIWNEFHDSMDQMHKRFEAIEKFMNETVPAQSAEKELDKQTTKIATKKSIEMSTDNNFVIVKLNLGELDSKEINIEAEENTLDGKIPLKDGSANFSIQNGRLFELSVRHEQNKQEKNDNDKTSVHRFESSSSAKIESLPEIVAHLEKTQVSYKNGVVELKLPKAAAEKKGKKLNVATT